LVVVVVVHLSPLIFVVGCCYLAGPWWRSMEIETRATRVS
jgi:hypothetical protein